MRTIDMIISATLSNRDTVKQIERDERVLRTYEKYPELQKIDNNLKDNIRANLMKILDDELDPNNLHDDEESKLIEKREQFLKVNCISSDFDKLWPVCEKCGDTGFIRKGSIRRVCNCMRDELEEAFGEAGLGDFASVRPSLLDEKAVKNQENKRKEARSKLDSVMASLIENKKQKALIYHDKAQTGKTYLSICFTKVAIGCGFSGCYVKMDELIGASDEKVSDYKYCDFLVIDDFSSTLTNNFKIRFALDRILETRLNNGKFTLIIMNESPSEAVDKSDEKIAAKLSRLECL
ncbi:MAG: hypothetical protein K6G47_11235 [Clostridia bacterium]|nr:hypothetical protein [Clostridia bacterium]